MRLSDSKTKRVAQAMAALSVLLVIAAAYVFWQDDSNPSTGGSGSSVNSGLDSSDSYDSAPGDSPSTEAITNPFEKSDPFANDFGSATKVYKVEFRATSDGPLRQLAYRVRDEKSGDAQLIKVSPRTWSMTRSIKGPRYVAEMAVQVYPTATYATCTLYIDGVKISSKTAKGNYRVAVCLA